MTKISIYDNWDDVPELIKGMSGLTKHLFADGGEVKKVVVITSPRGKVDIEDLLVMDRKDPYTDMAKMVGIGGSVTRVYYWANL